MINTSRKAHSPVISSFKSSMYFFALMSEYTWIVIHDHTTIIEAINEMYKCISLTKSPPAIVIHAAMIVIFFGTCRSWWCLWHILSRAKIKVVLLFYPAQYVQKSGVDLYVLWQKKRHLLDPVGANAHTVQRESQPARSTRKKKTLIRPSWC